MDDHGLTWECTCNVRRVGGFGPWLVPSGFPEEPRAGIDNWQILLDLDADWFHILLAYFLCFGFFVTQTYVMTQKNNAEQPTRSYAGKFWWQIHST